MKDVNLLRQNGVNVDASLELFGDMATYDDTLEDFLSGIDKKLNDMEKFKESADMANYSILAHSLKSDAKYFGFEKLADLSYQHELESKENNIYFIYDNFDELMTEARKIVNIVKQYLGKEAVEEIIKEIPKEKKDKTILVVDDSNVIRNFITKIFDNEYDVLMANDGEEAIKIIGENDDNPNIKIVGMLLDLNMPNVDGFDVLKYFETNNLFIKIPVSIITGDNSKETIEKAFKYDIIDVLSKPFNERDVKRIVERTINFV